MSEWITRDDSEWAVREEPGLPPENESSPQAGDDPGAASASGDAVAGELRGEHARAGTVD